MVVLAREILAGGLTLQLDIDARMPAKKLGGTIGIIFEEEVFHRIALMPGRALESWLNPSAHSGFMLRATLVPVVFRQRNHFTMGLQVLHGLNDNGRSYFPSTIFTNLSRTMIVLSIGLPVTASRTFGVASAAFSNSESEAPFFARMRSRTLPFICTAYSTSSTVRRFSL